MEILFWILFAFLIYSYLGYPLLMFCISIIINAFTSKKESGDLLFEPHVTLFVTAFNEIDVVHQKVKNSFDLDYPKDKLHFVWVTDGSTDGTNNELKKYPEITIFHQDDRKGKIHAMNRGMRFVNTPLVIFSDANTLLNKNCIKAIVTEFKNEKTGCVAGEKRIIPLVKDNAVNTGENIYWKYESLVKKSESKVNSAIGAVGELFAIRTELFSEIENNTILDDFVISLRIAQKGFKIKYTSEAYAEERASVNIKEELKRKTRIAFGAFQTLFRLRELLNPFKYKFLTFQYISHKVIRWTIIPLSLPLLFILNIMLTYYQSQSEIYSMLLFIQVFFYLMVLAGFLFQSKKIRIKLIFAPYYFFVMNYSLIIGFLRFLKQSQPINWERAKRG
ncbi:MAG: glycosyl transferase [Bacteroidetes bacterium GWF2_33_16]|nr:MAG: glycosyl transferase [Bacteroidetes bacterium GWE2_32_14]OFY04892.1 MAG: glycosyl transferase [Bacteroidetes bacterium GWF2_33_16]